MALGHPARHCTGRTTLLAHLAQRNGAGAVSFWAAEERHLEEDSKTHRTAVTSLTWSATGDRLISTDEAGKVGSQSQKTCTSAGQSMSA
jgi:hypothetical protein